MSILIDLRTCVYINTHKYIDRTPASYDWKQDLHYSFFLDTFLSWRCHQYVTHLVRFHRYKFHNKLHHSLFSHAQSVQSKVSLFVHDFFDQNIYTQSVSKTKTWTKSGPPNKRAVSRKDWGRKTFILKARAFQVPFILSFQIMLGVGKGGGVWALGGPHFLLHYFWVKWTHNLNRIIKLH